MDKDPFGYPLSDYMWTIGLAAVASIIRYLNGMTQFYFGRLLLDALSGGFTGLLTFWLCEASNIGGALSAFLIGVSGLMGNRAWQEFAYLFRKKFGLPVEDATQWDPGQVNDGPVRFRRTPEQRDSHKELKGEDPESITSGNVFESEEAKTCKRA